MNHKEYVQRKRLSEVVNEVKFLEEEFDGLCPVSILRNQIGDCEEEVKILMKKGILYHPDKNKNYLKRI